MIAVKCPECKHTWRLEPRDFPFFCCSSEFRESDGRVIKAPPRPKLPPAPKFGPGTELHGLFEQLAINPQKACGCKAMMDQMNRWGVEGCRQNLGRIMAHLRKAYKEASLLDKLKAGSAAWITGLPLTLEGLLEFAIELAAAKAFLDSGS